jgi:hypothetical protein
MPLQQCCKLVKIFYTVGGNAGKKFTLSQAQKSNVKTDEVGVTQTPEALCEYYSGFFEQLTKEK